MNKNIDCSPLPSAPRHWLTSIMVRNPIEEDSIFVKSVCNIFFIKLCYFVGKDSSIYLNIKIKAKYFGYNQNLYIFANPN